MLDPLMQQKLCLWLCLAVLLGALSIGNPFLPATGVPAVGHGRDAAPAMVESAPAAPPMRRFALDMRLSPDALGAWKALNGGAAAPVATPVSLRDAQPVDASDTVCPDPQLRAFVVAVERAVDGQPIWVLRDGRRLVRNPLGGTAPLLVPLH